MSHKAHYTPDIHEQPDSWHRHVPAEEGVPQEEHGADTKPFALATAFILCFAFVAGTILASYLYFEVHITALRREKIETTYFAEEFAKTKAAELSKQKDYYLPAENKARAGQAALPIEEAKKKVIARYAAK